MKRLATLLTLILSVSLLFSRVPFTSASALTKPSALNRGKKSCPVCPAGTGSAQTNGTARNLSSLGRLAQPQHLLPIQVSAFEGVRLNFVSTSNGSLAFAVTDLELSGTMPLLFQRVYTSDRTEDVGLGVGWSFVFGDRITVDGDAATLTTGAGETIAFRRSGQHFVLKADAPGLHQSFDLVDDGLINEQAAGYTHTYKKIGGAYRLTRIADANDNFINVFFNDRGNVVRITNGSGLLSLDWSEDKHPKLLSVTDNTGRRVGLGQDGQRLRAVTDAGGARWSYDYAAGRLTHASDPMGHPVLRVRYDNAGRAVEAGDAAGTYRFDYDSNSDVISQRTIVTDPVGAKTSFTHNGRGAVTAIADEEGLLASYEYNGANRPVRIMDSLGNQTTFDYDSQNRLLRQSSAGVNKSYTYDENDRVSSITDGDARTDYILDARGNIVASRAGESAGNSDARRNTSGQLISLEAKGGRKVSFEYDAAGNRTATTYSDAGRFESEYDAAGRVVAERLPSGLSYTYKYDARGALKKQADNNERSVTLERDASGTLVGIASADGRWVRATRDEAGRIIALANSSGKSRHYEYDARGSLIGYTDARGKHRTFTYDGRGRLRGVSASDGASIRYDYDRAGKLTAVRRGAGLRASAARLMAASYEPPKSPPPAAQYDYSCMFGGDGWYSGFIYDFWIDRYNFDFAFGIDLGMGCGDPFGGFLGDPFGGFYGETCDQCKVRQEKICEWKLRACVAAAVGVPMTAAAACLVAVEPATVLLCLGVMTLAAAVLVAACGAARYSCDLEIPDHCPMCN
ncbi:MAG: DUF6531 domain-containing protein [Acidobacteriota bacterium]|nr:DUF6531 domain-containing protein [Acidobacteriota bacterium]